MNNKITEKEHRRLETQLNSRNSDNLTKKRRQKNLNKHVQKEHNEEMQITPTVSNLLRVTTKPGMVAHVLNT